MAWTTIDSDYVLNVWKCEEEDCSDGNPEVRVNPTFYQENGEPSCCDRVMTYQRTEILI